jgi:hypothetical protein
MIPRIRDDERDFSGFLCAATKGLERKRWRCVSDLFSGIVWILLLQVLGEFNSDINTLFFYLLIK